MLSSLISGFGFSDECVSLKYFNQLKNWNFAQQPLRDLKISLPFGSTTYLISLQHFDLKRFRYFTIIYTNNYAKFHSLDKVYESSHQRCSIKKVFLKNSQNSQENTCAKVSFLIKLQVFLAGLFLIKLQAFFLKKQTLAQVFSCEFCYIFKNTFFT